MWKTLGASVAGASHVRAGRGCDDSSRWFGGAEVMCLTVADGAGSRPLAAHGSRIAVDTVAELGDALRRGAATPADARQWLTAVFTEVDRRIRVAAGGSRKDRGDYATTLAVAVVLAGTLAIAQIGDTIAVVGGPAGYRTVEPAAPGEYANETVFITHDDFRGHLRLATMPADEVDEVYLSTDGLRYKILDDLATARPYGPFFADVGAYARAEHATAESIGAFLDQVDDQTGDDLTLVVGVRVRPLKRPG